MGFDWSDGGMFKVFQGFHLLESVAANGNLEETVQLCDQFGDAPLSHGENALVIHAAIVVREDIAKTDDLSPRHFRVLCTERFGDMACGLTDNFQISFHSPA